MSVIPDAAAPWIRRCALSVLLAAAGACTDDASVAGPAVLEGVEPIAPAEALGCSDVLAIARTKAFSYGISEYCFTPEVDPPVWSVYANSPDSSACTCRADLGG